MAKTRQVLLSLLSALLLFAQHVAVTHAIWHQVNAAGHESLVARHAPQNDGQQARHLCDFDAMLGQLLAGGAVASSTAIPVADAAQALSAEAPRLLALALVQPRSRGPPSLL